MPSGKVHALVTVIAAGVSGPGLVMLAGQPIPQAAAFTAGCMAGLILSPDLDVDHKVHADGLVKRSGGCLLGALWRLFWRPYARLIPHRSPLSHWPVLGTAIRLIYLLAVPMLIYWGLRFVFPLPVLSLPHLTPLWMQAIGGLMLVDTLHAAMDWLF